jgi:DNA-binding transcriptional LysR family regulator
MWTDVPNLRHLRAFVLVAECGGITRAAQRIHLSQPAITQALAKLEERFSTKLLEFGSDGVTLTRAGTLLRERVERALELIETGAREALRGEARRSGGGFAHFEQLLTVAQLRALAAMAMTRNFSLAARELGLSQPSVHRAARDLERLTGMTMFVATRQGVDLTPSAEVFAHHAALAHAELQQGFAEVSDSLGRDPGLIVVGAMPFGRTKLLPDALNHLTRERPLARVRVISAPYDGLLGRLRYGIIDLLLGALRDPLPIDDVVQEPLFDDPLAIVARAGHPLVTAPNVGYDDLLAYPWAVPGDDTPTRAVFHQMFPPDAEKRMPGGTLETSSLVLLRGVLTGSDRLTLLSARQALYEIEQGLLAVVPYPVALGSRRIGLTFRRGWRPTPTQAILVEHLRRADSIDETVEPAPAL